MSRSNEPAWDVNIMPSLFALYHMSQIAAKVPVAEREVNINVTIDNCTCGEFVVTWKEDWTTDYGI